MERKEGLFRPFVPGRAPHLISHNSITSSNSSQKHLDITATMQHVTSCEMKSDQPPLCLGSITPSLVINLPIIPGEEERTL
jgi:hypothetical protein